MSEPRSQLRNPASPNSSFVIYTDEEREFMVAIDNYKRINRRPYPTWREVLRVLESLGYRKVEAPIEPPKFRRDSNSKGE
jgi:hypothetical protein